MLDKESCKALEKTHRETILENTLLYIENYLDPSKSLDKEITPKQWLNRIRYATANWQMISTHIKNMSYQDFLKTPYWKTIAAHIRYKAGYRCQLCNNANNLNTHHRDYGIHGFEHANMHELIALCSNCHNKFHNKSSQSKSRPFVILAIFTACLVYFFIGTGIFYGNYFSGKTATGHQKKSWVSHNALFLNGNEQAKAVHFTKNTLVVDLKDGRSISAPLKWYPRLLQASRKQRSHWEIHEEGYGIHWPELHQDLSIESLLRGVSIP